MGPHPQEDCDPPCHALPLRRLHLLCGSHPPILWGFDGLLWCYWLRTYNLLAAKPDLAGREKTKKEHVLLLVQYLQHCPLCDSHVSSSHWINVLDSAKFHRLQVLPVVLTDVMCILTRDVYQCAVASVMLLLVCSLVKF